MKGKEMTEGQISELMSKLVLHQRAFLGLTTEAAQLAITQPIASIRVFVDTMNVKADKFVLNTTIRVNRSIRPAYPNWVVEVMHPELEAVGPSEYDLAKQVELYLHENQKNGKWMKGTELYEHLKKTDILKNCLGLHDAVEIQKKGIRVFRKLFGGKAVSCWKSVVRHCDGCLRVPCVYDDGRRVAVCWGWLCGLRDRRPAARFVS